MAENGGDRLVIQNGDGEPQDLLVDGNLEVIKRSGNKSKGVWGRNQAERPKLINQGPAIGQSRQSRVRRVDVSKMKNIPSLSDTVKPTGTSKLMKSVLGVKLVDEKLQWQVEMENGTETKWVDGKEALKNCKDSMWDLATMVLDESSLGS